MTEFLKHLKNDSITYYRTGFNVIDDLIRQGFPSGSLNVICGQCNSYKQLLQNNLIQKTLKL